MYVKKTATYDAIQFTGGDENAMEIMEWFTKLEVKGVRYQKEFPAGFDGSESIHIRNQPFRVGTWFVKDNFDDSWDYYSDEEFQKRFESGAAVDSSRPSETDYKRAVTSLKARLTGFNTRTSPQEFTTKILAMQFNPDGGSVAAVPLIKWLMDNGIQAEWRDSDAGWQDPDGVQGRGPEKERVVMQTPHPGAAWAVYPGCWVVFTQFGQWDVYTDELFHKAFDQKI